MSLHLSKKVWGICNNSIFITGAARSGTTIMGKLIHSMEGVEYLFEPPQLFSLFTSREEIPILTWKLLYETYLYEDFFVNSLAGRNLNYNLFDDSSIFQVKTEEEIKSRQIKSWGKQQIEDLIAPRHRIAYKMPDVVNHVPFLKENYPGTQVLAMVREPNNLIHSIQKKGWFTNKSLMNGNLLWPNYDYKNFKIPHFVKNVDAELFVEMEELFRIGYYIQLMFEGISKIDNSIIVSYENFVKQPKEIMKDIAFKLNLTFGNKTDKLINEVNRKTPIIKEGLMEDLPINIQKNIDKLFTSITKTI